MNKRYVASSKAERIRDAEAWLDKLDKTPTYKRAIVGAKVMVCEDPKQPMFTTFPYQDTKVSVYNNDVAVCTKAAITHAEKGDRICVLDFASYYSPGGGFKTGALAQEESICRMSGLYSLLKSVEYVYEKRRENKKVTALYNCDYIYCKDVPFMVQGAGKVYLADVLVMAAPNANKAKQQKISDKEIDVALRERLHMAYAVPATYGCNTLLLGAFGCGVFGNDPEVVAQTWNWYANSMYRGLYKQVTHPVFDNEQSKIFRRICLQK